MIDFVYKDSYGVKDLEDIVRILRQPGGCPWMPNRPMRVSAEIFWKMAYEVVEAIDEGSPSICARN
jgi:tetrapyrrole methylase family protein/MazG family protein